jgi:hypothetical protein
MKTLLLSIFLALFLASIVQAKKNTALYDASKSSVYLLGKDNFDKQVTKHRSKSVSVVHFYKHDDEASRDFVFEYEKFNGEMQGVFKIGAVDCYKEWELCEKEKITKTPVVRIYPPLPVPPYDHEGELSSKAITGAAARFIGNKVIEINGTNVQKFIQDTPSVPKCLLFTDKATVPLLYKALSMAFDQKIFLGIVRKEETELFEKYGVKKSPQIIVVKPTEKKTIPYKGEIKYSALFDFLNIYTETFVPGGDMLDNEKPWSREMFPELHSKSAADICLGIDNIFCAIYLTETAPDQSVTAVIDELLRQNQDKNFKYMWLNVGNQKEFSKIFGSEAVPKLALYSHGKRKKYLVHEGEFNAKSIQQTFDKISNGDAKFTTIKQDIPILN